MPDKTVGQYLLQDILPEDVYQPGQVIDKKSVKKVFGDLARNHPDRYAEIADKAMRLGRDVARSTGGGSFTVEHLATPKEAAKRREALAASVVKVLDMVPPDKQDEAIVKLLAELQKTDKDLVYAEADAENNPLALLLKGAGRGNPASLSRIIASDLMYADAQGKPVPIPILNSYSKGLTPGEFTASSFGARKGVVEAKMSTASGGFLAKLIGGTAHRMVVTDVDGDGDLDVTDRGLPVETSDVDNVGSLLAKQVGPYDRNTPLTPKILAHLQKLGHDEILVRSPITTADPRGGVYARDVGIRERGGLPEIGEAVGITASAAVSEPVTQSALSAKHKGGIAEQNAERLSGFELIDKLFNPPKDFRAAATHAQVDGVVGSIQPAEQGGHYVTVGRETHYVPQDAKVTVKKDQRVEAGDQLSDGYINPREVVKHKGIGEGARQLTLELRRAIQASGTSAHRRNLELITRGLVDRVRVTGEFDDYVPDDVVPYNQIAATYKPREGHRVSDLQAVQGRYLEKPVLHYTIGTRVTPSVVERLRKHGVSQIATHADPPPFTAEMVRAQDLLQTDQDWMTRQLGTGLGKGLQEAVHRGRDSDEDSTSFVAARARAVDFGRKGPLRLNSVATSGLPRLGHQ